MTTRTIKFAGIIALFFMSLPCYSWVTSFAKGSKGWGWGGWVLQITNNTQNVQNIHAHFRLCADDHGYIQPGQTFFSWAGACQLKNITIDGGKSFQGFTKPSGIVFAIFEIRMGSDGRPEIVHTGAKPRSD